jgi:hypothetical protein
LARCLTMQANSFPYFFRQIISGLLLALMPAIGSAQGLVPTPRDDYNNLPKYDPGMVPVKREVAPGRFQVTLEQITLANLPPTCDLSDYLPEPGAQQFNDCVAWAISRGAYSYQFGMSRWRKPKADYDLFSPAFIYSQINRGRDNGSLIFHSTQPNAVKLLQEFGCATEATMPYDGGPSGWSAQPSRAAKTEANNFLTIDHERLDS